MEKAAPAMVATWSRGKGDGGMSGEGPRWTFWLPDNDRSSGWDNHTYVLQFVCEGYGLTADEAWASAKDEGDVPEEFLSEPEELIALIGPIGPPRRFS